MHNGRLWNMLDSLQNQCANVSSHLKSSIPDLLYHYPVCPDYPITADVDNGKRSRALLERMVVPSKIVSNAQVAVIPITVVPPYQRGEVVVGRVDFFQPFPVRSVPHGFWQFLSTFRQTALSRPFLYNTD